MDFGDQGTGMLREAAIRVDDGLDTNGQVNHAFHHYDTMADIAECHYHRTNSPTHDANMQDLGGSILGVDSMKLDGEFEDDDDYPPLEDSPASEREGCEDRTHDMLQESARTLLFAGARLSSLTTTLVLLNLCRTHGCSNLFITESFTILSMSTLPKINTLPK